MTVAIKNSSELNGPGQPGTSSRNSESQAGKSPRSNPVCLEVSLTIRSLPGEPGGLAQPIREDTRTVIVFDNGAVIRSTSNLPIGLKVILSNPSGRDVVCRVVGGRNLPSVKGYIEVEFVEPVNDFWGIHQTSNPVSVAASSASPSAPMESPARPPAPSVTSRAADSRAAQAPAKQPAVSLGSGPTFDDIPGLTSTPSPAASGQPAARPERPGLEMKSNGISDYDLSGNAKPTAIANWRSPTSAPPAEKRGTSAPAESISITSPAPAASRDFMSKGLMAYEQTGSASSASNGRGPLVIGIAATVLAVVCAVVFFMQRSSPPPPMNMAALTRTSTPSLPAIKSTPEPAPGPQEEAAPAPPTTQEQTQTQPQPVAVDQVPPAAPLTPVPAVVTNAATSDSRTDARNARRQEQISAATKQTSAPTPRRPAIPNLKLSSPSAPNKNLANSGEAAAPMTDVAATQALGATPPAGLLTSAGRISNPPAAPPSAPAPVAPAPVAAPKTVRDPQLISSTRPIYPAAAKQSNTQGTVAVVISLDENGKVVGAKALSGPPILRQAAVESVRQWKYSPGLTDGKPSPSQVTVNLEFRLN